MTARPRPNRYQHASQPLTVATPSCCSCCCCIVSGAATLTFIAVEVGQQQRNHDGAPFAVPLALTALPLAFLAAFAPGAPYRYVACVAVFVAVYTFAHIMAGSLNILRSIVTAVALSACSGLLIASELFVVLGGVDVLDNLLAAVLWLLGVPAAAWVAARVARLVTPTVQAPRSWVPPPSQDEPPAPELATS